MAQRRRRGGSWALVLVLGVVTGGVATLFLLTGGRATGEEPSDPEARPGGRRGPPVAPQLRDGPLPEPLEAVGEVADATVVRLANEEPVATSVALSAATFRRAEHAVLAGRDQPAAALAGAVLARHRGGPVLLTGPDRLAPEVAGELQRLAVDEVVVLGGLAAPDSRVTAALVEAGVRLQTVPGDTPHAVAAGVAELLPPSDLLYLAGPDPPAAAAAAAPLAARQGAPLLYTAFDGSIPSETLDALVGRTQADVVALGGEEAVSQLTATSLRREGREVERVAGADRYETAAQLYDRAVEGPLAPRRTWLAGGAQPGPQLAGAAAAAAAKGDAVLLVDGADLCSVAPPITRFQRARDRWEEVVLLGTTETVTGDAVPQLQACSGERPTLPGGGRSLFPEHRIVADYGGAQTAALGVLGEVAPEEAAARLQTRVEPFEAGDRTVLPGFELIATVALASPGEDGLYRAPTGDRVIERYLAAAREAGAILVLDVQPGRSDFLTEVRRYERFLREPDVGIALDPEWRMEPDERPGQVIGSVSAAEVNEVSEYVAGLVRRHDLPEKLFVIHQFSYVMLPDREQIVDREGLAVTLHVDGQGPVGTKLETYRALAVQAPLYNGFKLFFDEDDRVMSPPEVFDLDPVPDLITYQ